MPEEPWSERENIAEEGFWLSRWAGTCAAENKLDLNQHKERLRRDLGRARWAASWEPGPCNCSLSMWTLEE